MYRKFLYALFYDILLTETFTAVGLGRHMAKCTGPKQRQQSKGRGGKMGTENNSSPPLGLSTSSSNTTATQETGSNFGLTTTDMVTCPMCGQDFPTMLIELHADMCANSANNDDMMCGGGAGMEVLTQFCT